MNAKITPYLDSTEGKSKQVEHMFDTISEKYDLLNNIITFRMDKSWRRKVLKIVSECHPRHILDVATGTGDMAILLGKTQAENIIGVDISKGMLKIANEKISANKLDGRIHTEVQHAESLSFADCSFDIVNISYGVRNFENLEKGLGEMYRVMQSDGTIVILETSVPSNKLIKFGYLLYTEHLMPRIARIFSKDKNAYAYLSKSAINFPSGDKFLSILEESGFVKVKAYPQLFGAATIYVGKKQ